MKRSFLLFLTMLLTRIGERAFSSCPVLFSVTVPNSVTTIGDVSALIDHLLSNN